MHWSKAYLTVVTRQSWNSADIRKLFRHLSIMIVQCSLEEWLPFGRVIFTVLFDTKDQFKEAQRVYAVLSKSRVQISCFALHTERSGDTAFWIICSEMHALQLGPQETLFNVTIIMRDIVDDGTRNSQDRCADLGWDSVVILFQCFFFSLFSSGQIGSPTALSLESGSHRW